MQHKALRGCWMVLARDLLALATGLRTVIMLDYAFATPDVLGQLLPAASTTICDVHRWAVRPPFCRFVMAACNKHTQS